MAQTRTVFLDISRLARQGEDAAIVVRLMMACNDLLLANAILGIYDADPAASRQYVRRGAGLYLIRVQIAHLYELFEIVAAIADSSGLSAFVARCPMPIADAFQTLLKYVPGGPKRDEFEKKCGVIRNTTAFHYDPKLTLRALQDRAQRRADLPHKITTSNDISRIRFEVADDIIDTLTCRQILKIPIDANASAEADSFMGSTFELFKTVIDFAVPFIQRYIGEHAAK